MTDLICFCGLVHDKTGETFKRRLWDGDREIVDPEFTEYYVDRDYGVRSIYIAKIAAETSKVMNKITSVIKGK